MEKGSSLDRVSALNPLKINEPEWSDNSSDFWGLHLSYKPALKFGLHTLFKVQMYLAFMHFLFSIKSLHCFYCHCNNKAASLICTVQPPKLYLLSKCFGSSQFGIKQILMISNGNLSPAGAPRSWERLYCIRHGHLVIREKHFWSVVPLHVAARVFLWMNMPKMLCQDVYTHSTGLCDFPPLLVCSVESKLWGK